jgi:hypothetical protein
LRVPFTVSALSVAVSISEPVFAMATWAPSMTSGVGPWTLENRARSRSPPIEIWRMFRMVLRANERGGGGPEGPGLA